jgi:flagellar protein FlaF
MSVSAYHRTRSISETARATEYRLFSQITGEMIDARDRGLRGAALIEPLHRNRELWAVLASACGAPGNELPQALRATIISIGIWVDRFTSDVVGGREPVDALISVNRSILEGLAEPGLAA